MAGSTILHETRIIEIGWFLTSFSGLFYSWIALAFLKTRWKTISLRTIYQMSKNFFHNYIIYIVISRRIFIFKKFNNFFNFQQFATSLIGKIWQGGIDLLNLQRCSRYADWMLLPQSLNYNYEVMSWHSYLISGTFSLALVLPWRLLRNFKISLECRTHDLNLLQ